MMKKIDKENEKQLEELREQLKKQAEIATWIQAVGIIAEAIILTKLLAISEESEGENKVVLGMWIQTIGQLSEAIGVSKQVRAKDLQSLLSAQELSVNGDILQSIGAAIEAIGGKEVIVEEQIKNNGGFVT